MTYMTSRCEITFTKLHLLTATQSTCVKALCAACCEIMECNKTLYCLEQNWLPTV